MFSRMSAERFEKERQSTIGPGSYHIPAVFYDSSAAEKGQDAGQESSVGSFQVYEDAPERPASVPRTQTQAAPRTPKRKTLGSARAGQENHVPSATNAAVVAGAGKGGAPEGPDVEHLRRRLVNAEANAGDVAVAKRTVARAHAQAQAKDRQVEELRRQVEDLIGHQAQAQKRIGELENEKHLQKKVLGDKDNTIAALQKSIQHVKAQLEDRNRRPEAHDLATTRELAVEQAHRLAEQDAELKERDRELEEAKRHLRGLEKRFQSQTEATEARLRELNMSQERIHNGVLERELQAVKKVRGLEGVVTKQQCHEAHLVSQLLVRQASLEATLEMLAQEQRARREAEVRVQSLSDELETLLTKPQDMVSIAVVQEQQREAEAHAQRLSDGLETFRGKLQEMESSREEERQARQEAEARSQDLIRELETLRGKPQEARLSGPEDQATMELGVKFAELRGRLFLSEQTQTLGEERRRQLEEALAAKTAEAAGLSEAQDDLSRRVEELQSANLAVEASNEVQSAELEVLRLEVEELRQNARAGEAESRQEEVEDVASGAAAEEAPEAPKAKETEVEDAASGAAAEEAPEAPEAKEAEVEDAAGGGAAEEATGTPEAKEAEAHEEPDSQESSDVPAEDSDAPVNTSGTSGSIDIEPQSDTSMVLEDAVAEGHGSVSTAEASANNDVAARGHGTIEVEQASTRAMATCVVAGALEAAIQSVPAAAVPPKDASSTAELHAESTVHPCDPCDEAN